MKKETQLKLEKKKKKKDVLIYTVGKITEEDPRSQGLEVGHVSQNLGNQNHFSHFK